MVDAVDLKSPINILV